MIHNQGVELKRDTLLEIVFQDALVLSITDKSKLVQAASSLNRECLLLSRENTVISIFTQCYHDISLYIVLKWLTNYIKYNPP